MVNSEDTDRILQLEEDNLRLRRLLELKDVSGELRHRLRSTLSLLRAVIRRSAETRQDVPDYVAHLEGRLGALARAQTFADQYGTNDLRTLLADELLQYGALESKRLTLSGPDIQLQPTAGQLFALAIHELAINAVEHGVLGTAAGQMIVSWDVAHAGPVPSLSLLWLERGRTTTLKPESHGFGTEVLTRMLAYL